MGTPPPQFAVLPDSPDARMLVDLTSHANDLSEAAHCLKLAVDAAEGSALWEPLISHAITAYARPFILSNVRARLDHMPEFPGIPRELQDVHDTVRKYRNTTIAHSQSDLVMPLPVALLDEAGSGKNVIGVTLVHPVPGAFVESFAGLVDAMENLVDQATQPVLERLRAWLNNQTPETISRWPYPEVTCACDTDFTAAHTRSRKPRFTAYSRIEPEQNEE